MTELTLTPPPPRVIKVPPPEPPKKTDTPHNRIKKILACWKGWAFGEMEGLIAQCRRKHKMDLDQIEAGATAYYNGATVESADFDQSNVRPKPHQIAKGWASVRRDQRRAEQNKYNKKNYSGEWEPLEKSREYFAAIHEQIRANPTRHQGGIADGDVVRFENLPDVPLKPTATRI